MPLKAAIIPFLDEISEESKATGACNTIVKVPVASSETTDTTFKYKLVGTNTDSISFLRFPKLFKSHSVQF